MERKDTLPGLLRRAMPRAEPPDLPLDAILQREESAVRRGQVAAGFVALILACGAFLFLRGGEAEPPVHLKLRVVDAVPGESGLDGLENTPRELRGP